MDPSFFLVVGFLLGVVAPESVPPNIKRNLGLGNLKKGPGGSHLATVGCAFFFYLDFVNHIPTTKQYPIHRKKKNVK